MEYFYLISASIVFFFLFWVVMSGVALTTGSTATFMEMIKLCFYKDTDAENTGNYSCCSRLGCDLNDITVQNPQTMDTGIVAVPKLETVGTLVVTIVTPPTGLCINHEPKQENLQYIASLGTLQHYDAPK